MKMPLVNFRREKGITSVKEITLDRNETEG